MRRDDFTTGPIGKQLITFSFPILLTNLLQTSYQFIDSLWVGNLLGAHALGAVAISSTVIFTVLSFIIGINNATLTILSQLKGRDDQTELKNYVNAFIAILGSLSILFGLFGFIFSENILRLLGTPKDMIGLAKSYLQIHFLGILFLFGYNFISTVFRALGNSKTPLRFVFIAVILNAVLDPLLISGVGWGIHGAAIATVIAQGTAFLYGLALSLKHRMIPFSRLKIPTKEEVMLILSQGIPSGLQSMVISAGSAAIMSVITSLGSHVVSGYGAAQRLTSLIMLPAQALGTAVNSMTGQNIAVGKWKRVHRITLYATLLNLSAMVTLAIIVYFVAESAIRLFIQDAESVRFGTNYLRVVGFFLPFLGFNFVWNGTVRASGAAFQVLMLNIISFWVLRFPLTWVFSHLYGERGVAMGLSTSFVISSIFAFSYYMFGKWKQKELFETKDVAT